MSKGGRPRRQNVPRGSKGRIMAGVYRTLRDSVKKDYKQDDLEIQKWQRFRQGFEVGRSDPRLNSLLGRMFVLGAPTRIDEAMLVAGLRLMQILFVYDHRILNLYRHVRAQDIARERGLILAEDNHEANDRARKAFALVVEILGSYELTIPEFGGRSILLKQPGKLARSTFAICRDGGDESHRTAAEVRDGLRGLKHLAQSWGLYDDQQARIRRWRDREAVAAREARIMTPIDESETGRDV